MQISVVIIRGLVSLVIVPRPVLFGIMDGQEKR